MPELNIKQLELLISMLIYNKAAVCTSLEVEHHLRPPHKYDRLLNRHKLYTSVIYLFISIYLSWAGWLQKLYSFHSAQ